MTGSKTPVTPRTFFLNERHELARAQKEGGGRPANYGDIDWAAKGARISAGLSAAKRAFERSKDPLSDRHFFMVATPVAEVPKVSKDKKKAPQGIFMEKTDYAGQHSRVFRRLGLDLLDVDQENGVAMVHATAEKFDRLVSTANALVREGKQEQARWATIGAFDAAPANFRLDHSWLSGLDQDVLVDVVVEIQPLLTRVEIEEVLRAIVTELKRQPQEVLTGTGTDFSGRRWFRGRMRAPTITSLADSFFSVQTIHPPHVTPVASQGAKGKSKSTAKLPTPVALDSLPTVAILDTGVPAGHDVLGSYLRGVYRHPDAPVPYAGHHGSLVASRVVFGDHDGFSELPPPSCRFLDVMVAKNAENIEDKAVAPALEAIVATYPDVRVFNLSFGERRPIASYSKVEQKERLLLVQDLDNFVFARDVLVVVAAGNSPKGLVPTKPYPLHVDEPAWQLGAWPSGMNSLTCGSYVEKLQPEGLATSVGWPSPFSRVGPGVAACPVPEFSAHGGNLSDDWTAKAGMGVYGCTDAGLWEDHPGTSFSAPLLAREAAFAFQTLQPFCPSGARPFAVAVKAFLALTADHMPATGAVEALAKRTLGRGRASADRLKQPHGDSAVMMWQGVVDSPDDIVRVQLPIPLSWLAEAKQPVLRLVCSWDPPVNEAVREIWACRRVNVQLRTAPGCKALVGSKGDHGSYPIIDRRYDLSPSKLAKLDVPPSSDLWDLEISYEQIAEYYAGMTFSPQQRVAFAAELRDVGAVPVSPQGSLQALPIASTMTRLALPPAQAPLPVVLKHS